MGRLPGAQFRVPSRVKLGLGVHYWQAEPGDVRDCSVHLISPRDSQKKSDLSTVAAGTASITDGDGDQRARSSLPAATLPLDA